MPITLRQNRRFSYLYAPDLMPVLDYFIAHEPKFKCYNVVPDAETELLQAAKTVLEVSGKDLPIKVAHAGYGLNYSGSNARLKTEIPGLAFTPLKEAVSALYGYYQDHKATLNPDLLRTDK